MRSLRLTGTLQVRGGEKLQRTYVRPGPAGAVEALFGPRRVFGIGPGKAAGPWSETMVVL
jgi:hypothetical protein